MQKTYFVVAALIVTTFFGAVQAQDEISGLESEMESGRIAVEEIRGNGSSSGMAIEAVIRNTTSRALRLRTNLRRPLFLGNKSSRSSQNMLAFAVYGKGGSYYSDGERSFIQVPPSQQLDVQMIAYCTDYEKENPSSEDQFEISTVPSQLETIAEKIANYKRRNPEVDVTKAAQVALWLAQELSPEDIQATFPFSSYDESIAREILKE